jgi:transposase InsO family protein
LLFIAIDMFTKWIEVMPVVNITQEAVVKFLQSIIYRFGVPQRVLIANETQFKGAKFVRCCADFVIHHQPSSAAHPQMNGQVERANRLILQGMNTRIFHDLEARGRNWHKELPSVLWTLRTNVNRATKDTHFNLVYGAKPVLPSEIYLKSARVVHFNAEDQIEARELDSDLLEERRNTTLANVRKYQASLKRYYNKSVVTLRTVRRALIIQTIKQMVQLFRKRYTEDMMVVQQLTRVTDSSLCIKHIINPV